MTTRRWVSIAVGLLLSLTLVNAGCALIQEERQPYTTDRDKTARGAAIGAAVGTGVGFYMDRQEEKLARIPGTSVERVGEDVLLVRFDSNVLFDPGSAVVNPAGRPTLDKVASVLTEYNKTAVIIQGHTDSSGSEEANQELSERRAEAVGGHLVGRGIAEDRIASVGYGEGYPVASNTTAEGRQQNRRVDILLKAKAT